MVSRLVAGGRPRVSASHRRVRPGRRTGDLRADRRRRSPPPTATAWSTGGCGRRTCCSTTTATCYVADLGVDEICAGVVTFAATAYDAPERLGGLVATPAADVYSLGVLLHHLVSGIAATARRVARRQATARSPRWSPGPSIRTPSGRPATGRGAGRRGPRRVRTDRRSPRPFAPARNPYRGLAAFEQADAADFFGRDAAVAEMLDVLATEQLLVVVGPSGIGKSSVVKAGLLPALQPGCDRRVRSAGWSPR